MADCQFFRSVEFIEFTALTLNIEMEKYAHISIGSIDSRARVNRLNAYCVCAAAVLGIFVIKRKQRKRAH